MTKEDEEFEFNFTEPPDDVPPQIRAAILARMGELRDIMRAARKDKGRRFVRLVKIISSIGQMHMFLSASLPPQAEGLARTLADSTMQQVAALAIEDFGVTPEEMQEACEVSKKVAALATMTEQDVPGGGVRQELH